MNRSQSIFALVVLLLPTNAAADITTGLIAYWRMDDGTGTTAVDASGNGRTGTLTGGASFAAGKLVGGVDLDGTDGRVVVTHHSSLSPTNITVAAWINPDVWASGVAITSIVSKQADQAGFPAFDLRKQSFGTGLSAAISVGGTAHIVVLEEEIETGIWTHVAFTYDGDTLAVYINGVAETNENPNGGLQGSTADLWIGGNPSFPGGRYFNGKIDEVRIYNRPLTETEITELRDYRRPEPLTRTIPGSAAADPVGSTIPGGP